MGRLKGVIRRSAAFVDRWQGLLLLAASPFFLFPSPSRSPGLLILPILWLAGWIARGEPVPRTPLNSLLVVLMAMVGVSAYATFDLVFSLPKITGVLLGIAVFFALVRWCHSFQRLWWAIYFFQLAGAGLAVIGILGTQWTIKVPFLYPIIKHLPAMIRGLPGAQEGFHPNAVAGALVLFIPLQVICLRQVFRRNAWPATTTSPLISRRLWLVGVPILLLITTLTLVLTASRGAWVGCGLALVSLLAWHSRKTRFILIILLAAFMLSIAVVGPGKTWILIHQQVGSNLGISAEGRLEVWSRALYGIQDFPFTGMGMNTFRRIMPVLYPAFLLSPDFDVAHCHNHLLQAALDLGIPGLIAYLGLWLESGFLIFAITQKSSHPWMKEMAEGLGAGLLAHFIFGIGDAIPLGAKVGIFFWITLALAVSLYLLHSRQSKSTCPNRK